MCRTVRSEIRRIGNEASRGASSSPTTSSRDTVKLIEKRDVRGSQKVAIVDRDVDVAGKPVQEALKIVLNAVAMHGDSPKLRRAIDVLLAKEIRPSWRRPLQYLAVLYAAMRKSDTLLDYLLAEKRLPQTFRFTVHAPEYTMLADDLWKEEDIPLLAGHEFRAYGQPFDTFPQALLLESPSRDRICKGVLGKRVNELVDVTFSRFVRAGQVASAACLLPEVMLSETLTKAAEGTASLPMLQLLAQRMDRENIEHILHCAVQRNDGNAVLSLFPFLQKETAFTTDMSKTAMQIGGKLSLLDILNRFGYSRLLAVYLKKPLNSGS